MSKTRETSQVDLGSVRDLLADMDEPFDGDDEDLEDFLAEWAEGRF